MPSNNFRQVTWSRIKLPASNATKYHVPFLDRIQTPQVYKHPPPSAHGLILARSATHVPRGKSEANRYPDSKRYPSDLHKPRARRNGLSMDNGVSLGLKLRSWSLHGEYGCNGTIRKGLSEISCRGSDHIFPRFQVTNHQSNRIFSDLLKPAE